MATEKSRLASAVGSAIKEWRVRRRMTLAQLADSAGIDTGFLAYIESGKKAPSLRTLERISDALGLAAGELFKQSQGPAKTLLRAEAEALCQNCTSAHLNNLLKVLRILHDPAKVKAVLTLAD